MPMTALICRDYLTRDRLSVYVRMAMYCILYADIHTYIHAYIHIRGSLIRSGWSFLAAAKAWLSLNWIGWFPCLS